MSHRMNTMPTTRRGRTYVKSGDNDSRGLGGFCSALLIIGLLVVPPLLLYGSERTRYVRYLALSEALDGEIVELNRPPDGGSGGGGGRQPSSLSSMLRSVPPGTMVHGTSSHVDAAPTDGEMSVSIPGALVLRRNCEYCQWQELHTQHCNTCTRTVKAKDGSSVEESYQCDCVSVYNYVKSWRSHRINSLLFDQPGAHHNPQRDPMPSRTFVDESTMLMFTSSSSLEEEEEEDDNGADVPSGSDILLRGSLDPTMLSSGVRGWPYRRVEFTREGIPPPPPFFSRLFSWFLGPSNVRYEPLRLLSDTTHSIAAIEHNFVYVGQGGYFFSPHESSRASRLFNYFAQYLEGSLFDWQVGDLMPSCTAGDVRFYYEVQDPAVVSVLGQMGSITGKVAAVPRIQPRSMDGNGIGNEDVVARRIGLVHAGIRPARVMLMDEDSDSRNRAHLVRGLLLMWSIPVSRLAGVALGRELGGKSSTIAQVEGALGLFLVVLGAMWLMIWGKTSYDTMATTVVFLVGGGVLCSVAYHSAYRMGGGRRWHAVWCRVLRWANTPPEWRVEDTYVGGFTKVDGEGSSNKKM